MLKALSKKKNQDGFTLIELIVVIAIIGILAAIALPRLGAFRDGAEKGAAVAEAASIASATRMYLLNNTEPADAAALIKALDTGEFIEKDELGINVTGVTFDSGTLTQIKLKIIGGDGTEHTWSPGDAKLDE